MCAAWTVPVGPLRVAASFHITLCLVAHRAPATPLKTQLHVVSSQEDIGQRLEFNGTSRSVPGPRKACPGEEDPIWTVLKGPTAAERVTMGGREVPEGWSEVLNPQCSHSEMTPASSRHRPQP